MHKILFICHGNICRSTMAEFVMKDIVRKAGKETEFLIESAATSREEIGNDTHYGTKRELDKHNIPYTRRAARQATKSDYDKFDLLIGMDEENIYYMTRIFGGDPDKKFHKLLEYCGSVQDVADPWYTGNFETTYVDVDAGCQALFKKLTA